MPENRGSRPPYSDEELANIVGNELSKAGDFADDFLEENRRLAWRYYLGRREGGQDFGPTTDREGYTREGQSQAVSEDVADMVEALMATLMPVFGSDVPVEFEPVGPGDEEQASAESQAVANVLMEQNNGWQVLAEAIKDCLLLRNGTIKVWIEERTEVLRKTFKEINDEQLAIVVADIPEGIDVQITSREGQRASLKLSQIIRKPRVKAIQQALFLLDPNHDSISIEEANFVAERKFPKRSDLVAEGLKRKQVEALPAFTQDTDIDSTAKNIEGQSQALDSPVHDQDTIEVFEVYMRIDMDGDGVSELMRFLYSNREILDKTEVDLIPYATGTGWLVPHRYSGLSVFDKIQQASDIKSRVLQQYLDNLTTNNTARTIVNENTINLDDMLNGRPNAIVRNDGIPAEGALPMPVNDTGASSQALLDYMDKVRDQRAGAALSLMQPQDQLVKAGISAQSVDRQMSAGEQMAGMVARTIAETLVRSTFLLLHEVLRAQFPEQIMLNRSGQWIPTSPQEWPQRNRLNIKVGLSPAERSQKASVLQQTISLQQAAFGAGGQDIIVSLNGIHRAVLDWSRASNLDNAEKYWVDPESQESQAAAVALQEKQDGLEQAQLATIAAEAAAVNANGERDFVVDQMKIQFDYFDSILKAGTEESKIAGAAEAAVQAQQAAGQEGAGANGREPGVGGGET